MYQTRKALLVRKKTTKEATISPVIGCETNLPFLAPAYRSTEPGHICLEA